MSSVNAEMPIQTEAAYVGESRGMQNGERLGGDERIIRPRAPDTFQPKRGFPNGYDLRFCVRCKRKGLHRLHARTNCQAFQRASKPFEGGEALRKGFIGRLEHARPRYVSYGSCIRNGRRTGLAFYEGDGNVCNAEIQGIGATVQQKRIKFCSNTGGDSKVAEVSKTRFYKYAGIKHEAKICATWNTKESRAQDQCNQASEKSDEIVCSYANNKRKKHRIKSRCDNNRTNNNALLRKLKAKGNIRPFGGGNVILEEIMYIDSSSINVNSYSGYEAIGIGVNSPISAAQFSIAQYAGAVTMSGLEMLQNSSKEQIIDLMEGRIKVTEAQIQNRVDYDLYQNGTGNSGKNLTGLAAAVADDPTTGTYGGIARATWPFWQNHYYRGVTDGGAAVSAANIQAYMTTLGLRCVRGSDMPDLWVGSANYYGFYVNSMQAIQRVTSDGGATAGAGFPSLKFYGGGMAADVVLGGGINGDVDTDGNNGGEPTNHMYALNTNYIFFRPHRDRNFVPIGGERQSVNQDAIVKLIGWAGNLTSSGPQFCGVLVA